MMVSLVKQAAADRSELSEASFTMVGVYGDTEIPQVVSGYYVLQYLFRVENNWPEADVYCINAGRTLVVQNGRVRREFHGHGVNELMRIAFP